MIFATCLFLLSSKKNPEGKTWLLNKLFGVNLPAGKLCTTRGLSFLWIKERRMLLIDSAGVQSTVSYRKQAVDAIHDAMTTESLVFKVISRSRVSVSKHGCAVIFFCPAVATISTSKWWRVWPPAGSFGSGFLTKWFSWSTTWRGSSRSTWRCSIRTTCSARSKRHQGPGSIILIYFDIIWYIYIYWYCIYNILLHIFWLFPKPRQYCQFVVINSFWFLKRCPPLCRWCLALWAIFSICSLSLNVFPSFRVFPQQRWLRVSAQVKVRCRFWRFQKVLVQIPGKYSGSGGSRVVIPQSFHVICFQTVSFVSQVWWRVLWFRDGVGQSLPSFLFICFVELVSRCDLPAVLRAF